MKNWISHLICVWIIAIQSGYTQVPTLEEAVFAAISEEYLMPREKLWVAIFVTHQDKPTTSKIAYLELLNRDNVPVVQEMTALAGGYGNGYLTIPQDLPSDYYLLRVYTRNSPHFSPSKGVYHQLIGIVNPDIPQVQASKPVNDSFFLSSTENLTSENQQLFHYNSDGGKINITLMGQPTDRVTVSLAFNGQFPPVPKLNEDKLYDAPAKSKTYIPEIFSHVIHGKNLERAVDTTETFFLSVHGLESKLLISKAKLNGDVFFETGGFSHFDFVIIQSDAKKDQLDFVLESPYWQQKPISDFTIPYLDLSELNLDFLSERMVASQATTYFQSWETNPIPSNPRLFLPDNAYILDDFNRFDDMATVIREYVPEVLVRRDEKQTVFRSINRPANQVFKNNPLILIDALPVFDSDAFSKFNPVGIRQMDILNRQFYFNHKLFEGAIVLTSFKNDFGKFDLPKNALFIEYKGVQLPLVSNKLDDVDQHLANLSSLLLWKTFILNDENRNLTLDMPQHRENYQLKITNWSKTKQQVERIVYSTQGE